MDYTAQEEEVQALKAIYDDDFQTVSAEQRTYSIIVGTDWEVDHASSYAHSCTSVELLLTFPEDYPSSAPPVYELRALWLNSTDLHNVAVNFNTIYSECRGEVVVYQWVEWMREFIAERAREMQEGKRGSTCSGEEETVEETTSEVAKTEIHSENAGQSTASSACQQSSTAAVEVALPTIVHGEPLTDRKSTFQAHVAAVTCVAEVKAVLSELKSSRKIATATHNILAYRVYDAARGVYTQDCDDDGESAAGGRLLHLLQIMDVRNVMVVVTRWFGGILLHADRFKHINNVARITLQESGLGIEHKQSLDKKDKPKNVKSKHGRHRH